MTITTACTRFAPVCGGVPDVYKRQGYNRAARIIEQMEAQGIVSEQGHNGNREVLAPPPFD